MTEVVDTRDVDGIEYRAVLVHDDGSESPREWCNVGVMVAPSSRCVWPTEHGDRVSGSEVVNAVRDHSFQAVARWLRLFYGATVVLPLYHRGDERPTAGAVTDTPAAGNYLGVVFDQESTREATGFPGAEVNREAITSAMATEVDTFSAWAVGETYGYLIERRITEESDPIGVDICEHDGWEQVDSLFGLIGDEYAADEARRALSDAA